VNFGDQQDTEQTAEFPIAEVRDRPGAKRIVLSKMWWVTLVCVTVAFVLTWQSMPLTGPRITIEFSQGHGLKAGDALRHRGIDVGVVQEARLKSDLSGIQVTVELNPEAEILCRKGSRFWVVRPHVTLTGIQGLETIVGARYIAVSPGAPNGAEQRNFDGLVTSPPDEFAGDGLELMLRADIRSGLNPGAPVTWRGVQVGQVLSVGLSPDAKHVNTGVRIDGRYRQLVKSNSKFWVTSGFGVHIGLSGIDLNADSLASLALGGISFITPQSEKVTSVRNGHVFALHRAVDSNWLEDTAVIPLVKVELPETLIIEGSTETSFLGIRRRKPFSATGTFMRDGNSVSLLTAKLPVIDGGEGKHVPELCLRRPGSEDVVTIAVPDDRDVDSAMLIIDISLDHAGDVIERAELLRRPTVPEDCCVVRTVFSEGRTSSVVYSIDREQLTLREECWLVSDNSNADLSAWNGAPVVSLSDGRVIGVLITTEQGTAVARIPAALVD